MEKRKWDVNSISVIQFSCEIKRKARIWEIWKLQLQDKWYLKGSYLIWLNFSSNVITEMHYLQVFSELLLMPSQAVFESNQRGEGGLMRVTVCREVPEESLGAAQSPSACSACGSLPCRLACSRCRCAKGTVLPGHHGFGWGVRSQLLVVPPKNAFAVKFCSLAES